MQTTPKTICEIGKNVIKNICILFLKILRLKFALKKKKLKMNVRKLKGRWLNH